jgi:Protein of unknown function (DUF4245)
MTDDATGSDPTSQPGRSWRIPALVAGLVIVIVVAVAVAVGRGGDDDSTDASSDPTSTSTTTPSPSSASESPSTSGSPSASASPSAGDPTPSPVINKAAKAAIRDDFPALVPAGVPAGWTVVSASYRPNGGGVWQIELTDPAGNPVSLRQSTETIDVQLAQVPAEVEPAGTVDLSNYGTGTWKAYAATGTAVLAKKLSGTSAIVVGIDQDTVVELVQELLTAEDSGTSDNGG